MPFRLSKRSFRLSTLLILVAVVSVAFSVLLSRKPLSIENISALQSRQKIECDAWKVRWNDDGTRVAIIGWEQPVQILDGVTLWNLRTIGDGKKIIHFAFSPDPSVVAYCENGSLPRLLNLETGDEVEIDGQAGQSSLDFSPDGQLLATGVYGHDAQLWDTATGKHHLDLKIGDTQGGLTPRFSPDGQIIAIGNRNSTTRLFDPNTGELLHELPERMSQELCFHPQKPVLAIAYVDGSIRLWDTQTGRPLHWVQTTADEIYTLDWSPDGSILVSAGKDGNVDFWNESLSRLHSVEAAEWMISVRFRPDMRGLFVAGGGTAPGSKRFVEEWVVPTGMQRWMYNNASSK